MTERYLRHPEGAKRPKDLLPSKRSFASLRMTLERHACSGEHRPTRAEKVDGRLIVRIGQIFDVQRQLGAIELRVEPALRRRRAGGGARGGGGGRRGRGGGPGGTGGPSARVH